MKFVWKFDGDSVTLSTLTVLSEGAEYSDMTFSVDVIIEFIPVKRNFGLVGKLSE